MSSLIPQSIAVNSIGDVFISDSMNAEIRKISGGIITRVVGTGTGGYSGDNGSAILAQVGIGAGANNISANGGFLAQMAFDATGQLYFPDKSNRIRRVCLGAVIPAVSVTPSATSVCAGTAVGFTSSISNGGISPTYQWTVNGTNVGTTSTYTYTPANGDIVRCTLISNATCATTPTVSSTPITMTVNPLPAVYTVSGSGSYSDSAIITVGGSQTGVNYQLYKATAIGSPKVGTGASISFTVMSSGTYFVVATNTTTGCTDTMSSSAVISILPTAIETVTQGRKIVIVPNPAQDIVSISGATINRVQIYNLVGQCVIDKRYNSEKVTIDIRNLITGLYVIRINNDYLSKIIKG